MKRDRVVVLQLAKRNPLGDKTHFRRPNHLDRVHQHHQHDQGDNRAHNDCYRHCLLLIEHRYGAIAYPCT